MSEKSYEIKLLLEKLKARGLDLAEEAAVIFIDELVEWLQESAAKSENKVDDLIIPALPYLKKIALQHADKIDGKEDLV